MSCKRCYWFKFINPEQLVLGLLLSGLWCVCVCASSFVWFFACQVKLALGKRNALGSFLSHILLLSTCVGLRHSRSCWADHLSFPSFSLYLSIFLFLPFLIWLLFLLTSPIFLLSVQILHFLQPLMVSVFFPEQTILAVLLCEHGCNNLCCRQCWSWPDRYLQDGVGLYARGMLDVMYMY